ncbi:uncharacterized protein LOC144006777 isoform X1 [Festucalex cinctus]
MTKSFDMSPAVCRRPLTLSISALFSSLVVPKHLWALEKRPVTGTVLNWSSWRNYLATEILRLSEEDKHSQKLAGHFQHWWVSSCVKYLLHLYIENKNLTRPFFCCRVHFTGQ